MLGVMKSLFVRVSLEITMETLTQNQQAAFVRVQQFVNGSERCLILKGYAGTGKTFLIGHIAQWLETQNRTVALAAPTGRAARVLASKTNQPAATIHRYIYNLNKLKEKDERLTRFKFYFELRATDKDDLAPIVIVDESSMVADHTSESEFLRFGSGRLLTDLVEFMRLADASQNSKIILVGDDAQLPPVGNHHSPALDPNYLHEKHGIAADVVELTEVVRQAADSPILAAATKIRDNLRTGNLNQLSIEPAPPDITPISTEEVAERWARNYKDVLPPRFVCITHANDTALRHNLATRARLWGGDGTEELRPGDFVMVIANNRLTGLLNGDLALIKQVLSNRVTRNITVDHNDNKEVVPLHFRRVTLAFEVPGEQPTECSCMVLENVLHSPKRDLLPAEMKALYIDFKIRHPHLTANTEAFTQTISSDEYFNAARIKYGYAATCHKAQGGEWDEAVVIFESQRTDQQAQRWTYTAITRTKKILYGVNLPHRTPWDGLFKNRRSEVIAIQIEPDTMRADQDLDGPVPLAMQLPEGAPELLTQRHTRAVNAWQNTGIQVVQVIPRIPHRHIQYQLQKGNANIWLNMNIKQNKSFRLSPTKGTDAESELFKSAEHVFMTSHALTFPDDKPMLREFYEQAMGPKAAETGYRIVNVEHRPYVERYTFIDQAGELAIADYCYNKNGKFTTVNVISGNPLV
jgi:tRNA A37 threonylcarbamoyladenosine biosynthesis protein TsaE